MARKNATKNQNKSAERKKSDAALQLNLPIALALKQSLINHGYKGSQLEFLLTQAAHESNGFRKDKAISDLNFGGVKWNKNMKGMMPSTVFFAPLSEGKKTPYVHFRSMDEFAEKWPRMHTLMTCMQTIILAHL